MEQIACIFTGFLGIELCGVRPGVVTAPCHGPRYEYPIHSIHLPLRMSAKGHYQSLSIPWVSGCLRLGAGAQNEITEAQK
jgi:hypothetical protein